MLALAFLLAGCATLVPLAQDTTPFPGGPCHEDRLVTEHLAHVPGVRMFRSPHGFQVRIRGALEEPLYILDGSPLAPMPGSALLGAVNPCDIADIRVLSDPADLTFYGPRARGGVVVITTRKR